MNVVVYYRSRPREAAFSDQALKEQRDAVSCWLTENPTAVIAEYVEAEIDGASRPRLAEAIATCKRTNARLLIARTEPVGSGSLFEPRIRSVSVAIAPKTNREIGHVIPSPHDALPGYSLCFPDYRATRAVPVYLCNNTDDTLRNLQVTVSCISSKIESLPKVGEIAGSPRKEPPLAPGTSDAPSCLPARSSILIERYEPMTDGETIMSYAITFTAPGGQRRHVSALIGPGGLTTRFIKLD